MADSKIGRKEVLIGAGVAVVVALLTLPLLWGGWGTTAKSRRAEVQRHVEEIRTAELALQKAFGEYASADPAPRRPEEADPNPVPWVSNRGFDKLAWAPDTPEQVYGVYSVSATRTGFEVRGTCDTDGDGRRATFLATEKAPAQRMTDEDVY